MGKWKVTAIQVGSYELDRSAMTHYKGKGQRMKVPIWCAAATDGIHKVLVDTGIRDIAEYKKIVPGVSQSPDQSLDAALKRIMGWSPVGVDVVINTHLHRDHCGSNYLFDNARFYLQKTEWEAAFSPLVPEKMQYDETCYNKDAINYFQWSFLDGDAEILTGLRIITTPGHTRGHQSVLFDTFEGVVCVSGDICNLAENVNENLEPNIVVLVEETYKSLAKIRRLAHFILPGHEPAIEDGSNRFIKVL